MPRSSLSAQTLESLLAACVTQATLLTGLDVPPRVVISPYRFNPLGAHIDHQGGSVLARCLNQYTILCFWPTDDASCTVHANLGGGPWQRVDFRATELVDEYGWDGMARAAATAFADYQPMDCGINCVVFGTLVSGGLSSSSSVILAYLSALADVNDATLGQRELVELSRRVENDYRGLNNGIQDQMSIAFGQKDHLSVLDVDSVKAELVADPVNVEDVCFLMCYSGVSRDLGGSPFNTRVAECGQAADLLFRGATHLGQVPAELRGPDSLATLPDKLSRRARHVYSEMARVQEGACAWRAGDWRAFGQLMNASCQSSIYDYQSGSEWLIALHDIARGLSGVYGNRFSGGGYGGCLFMLVDKEAVEYVADNLMSGYLSRYPDRRDSARLVLAESESTVRVVEV